MENFLNFVNDKQDIIELRKELRADLESCGMGYLEVVRNLGSRISELHLLPAHSMRLVATDKYFTQYIQRVRDSEGKFVSVTRNRRFGRFVQNTLLNEKIYFKEFGDPRRIGSMDGNPNGRGKPANEVIVFKIHSAYSPYGLPRWLGNMMAILGSRKAEEVNYLFFDNKTIPPLIITVSGGALTGETLEKLELIFEKELKGIDNFHKMLLLEATPHSASDIPGEKVSPVRIEVKPLTEYISKDALFGQYRKDNRKNTRSSFKLPPIYTGDSDDYTRATALESARVAEEQVFGPERDAFDYIFNRIILPDMEVNFWKFKSLGVKTSDDTDIVTAMGLVKEALPVAVIQQAVAEMRNVPEGNIPENLHTMTLAEHQAQTFAANKGTEDGDEDETPPAQNNGGLSNEQIEKIANRVSTLVGKKIEVIQR
jgi:PBSX family phage portal protein